MAIDVLRIRDFADGIPADCGVIPGLTHGTVAYSPAGRFLFAVWDERGRCRYAAPAYDVTVEGGGGAPPR